MFRMAKETVTLQDGTQIPKGAQLAFANDLRLDRSTYPDPETFDAYRFLRMRDDPAQSKQVPFTKTTYSHLAFGHGKHACPGRFLVCNEVKVILSHILMKYDIKAIDGEGAGLCKSGMFVFLDPRARMFVRRRQEEIPI